MKLLGSWKTLLAVLCLVPACLAPMRLLGQDTTLLFSEDVVDGLRIMKPAQKSFFRANGTELVTFIAVEEGGSYDLRVLASADEGMTWEQVSTAPALGTIDYYVESAAALESDGCNFHMLIRGSATTSNFVMLYVTYDRCSNTWTTPEVMSFAGEDIRNFNITLYEKDGDKLPAISLSMNSPWRSFINYQTSPGNWFGPPPTYGLQSSNLSYFAGHILHVLDDNRTLVVAGRVSSTLNFCGGYTNNLYERRFDLITGNWLGTEMLIHPNTGNDASSFRDADGNLWLAYLSKNDENCNFGQGAYVSRLEADGSAWETYFIDFLSADPTAPWPGLTGILFYNTAFSFANDTLRVVFSNGGENYNTIYQSRWMGSGFSSPTTLWSNFPSNYRHLRGLTGHSPCVYLIMRDQFNDPSSAWFFSECQEREYTPPSESDNYWLEVPTAFTPNADGRNDLLDIFAAGVADLNFRVYNRWGEMIFETTDPSITWDGTVNGKQAGLGTYYWTASYNRTDDGSGESKSGSVTLIR